MELGRDRRSFASDALPGEADDQPPARGRGGVATPVAVEVAPGPVDPLAVKFDDDPGVVEDGVALEKSLTQVEVDAEPGSGQAVSRAERSEYRREPRVGGVG